MDVKKYLSDMDDYERKHFNVKVERDRFEENKVSVNITTNGFQWFGFGCLDENLPKVYKAIGEFLKNS